MNYHEQQKRIYEVDYKKMKEKGYPFHPFSTWKDIVVALIILAILIGLSLHWGVQMEDPADPTSQYLPRPEWYFMFLFELLKLFPSYLAFVPAAVIPGLAGLVLVLLPFFDRNPYRSISKRPVALTCGVLSILALVLLTAVPYWQDAHTPHVLAGGPAAAPTGGTTAAATGNGGAADGAAIFNSTCKMCHGPAGTQIPGVRLFDKSFIGDKDVVNIVTNGTAKGMPSFKSQFSADQIKAVAAWVKSQAK